MRYCIMALILRCVSFSTAKLESYQTPHIPEELKTFNCDGKVYDYNDIQFKRVYRVRYSVYYLEDSDMTRFGDIARAQGINTGVMYHDESTTTKYHFLSFYFSPESTGDMEYFFVYDDQSRACAMIIRSTGRPIPGKYRSDSSEQPAPKYRFCQLQQQCTD
ncbi:BgtE-20038 [Blumeria graminis f. sp. tritici]|uniref:BgtE-20038 n=2 Tax=Blumeria graminis f. sp. tritici TaxID=62690 RepID=A0A9X9PRP5_BLUGR|nr:BgtE-20038 [Blumeria graminis f. sp. tritici]